MGNQARQRCSQADTDVLEVGTCQVGSTDYWRHISPGFLSSDNNIPGQTRTQGRRTQSQILFTGTRKGGLCTSFFVVPSTSESQWYQKPYHILLASAGQRLTSMHPEWAAKEKARLYCQGSNKRTSGQQVSKHLPSICSLRAHSKQVYRTKIY